MTDECEKLANLIFKAVRIEKEMREIEHEINDLLKNISKKPHDFRVWERVIVNDD